MNDKFKFRGLAKNNEWCYGSLLYYADDAQIWEQDGKNYIVNPETVGQCIGLKDKNGNLIYEGDIVKSDFNFITNTINPLKFKIGNVISSDYIAGFVIASDINDYSPYKTSFFGKTEALNCIVIGNIYENKELLESEG